MQSSSSPCEGCLWQYRSRGPARIAHLHWQHHLRSTAFENETSLTTPPIGTLEFDGGNVFATNNCARPHALRSPCFHEYQ